MSSGRIFKKAVSVRQIQLLDKTAIEKIGIPSIVLMENAGRAVFNETLRHIKERNAAVSVFCGVGNNGGDGFVAARHLANHGIRTKVFLIGQTKDLKSDAAVNWRILNNLRHPVKEVRSFNEKVLKDVLESDVIIDAIFGVGLNRDIRNPFRDIIKVLNAQGKKIISVDVPSGLDAATGKIHGVCIRAFATVTFSFLKKGFLRNEGPDYVGKVVVADIGIPLNLLHRIKKYL